MRTSRRSQGNCSLLATAGRVLVGYGSASESTRRRVLASAERLGYRRNDLARSMTMGRTHTIGFVGADIEDSFFARAMR